MKYLFILIAASWLAGCAATPSIELGAEVAPPYGCTDARRAGNEC